MSTELINAEQIVKNFGLTKALQGVHFTLNAGEIRGLIGENGSGKSTLCSILAGVYPADSGQLYLNGQPYSPTSMIDAQRQGVAMIVQEMGTISGIRVADNLFVGKEKMFAKAGLVNRKAMVAAARKALTAIGVTHIDPRIMIDELNFEDRKLVEVARAVYDRPQILIVDETTTALSQQGRDIIYSLCRRFSEQGKGIIFISHDLDEILEICTALTVLRDGMLIGTLAQEEMKPDVIKSMMVGRELIGDYYRGDVAFYIIYSHTRFGYNVRSLGNNQLIATNIGVNEKRNTILCYVLCGVFLGVASCINVSMKGTIEASSTFNNNMGMMFTAFPAVFIALYLSRYVNFTVGVFIGAFCIKMLTAGILALGLPSEIQDIGVGLFLFLFIALTTNQGRFSDWRLRRLKARPGSALDKA